MTWMVKTFVRKLDTSIAGDLDKMVLQKDEEEGDSFMFF